MNYILGVDPGLDGGVALMSEDGKLIRAYPMPTKERKEGKRDVNIAQLNQMITETISLVVVEQVSSMPKQGVASTFAFGKGYGKILGWVESNGWSLEEPRPQTWKKEILRDTAKDKAAAINYVLRRFPSCSLLATERSRKHHDGMAEALCLAEYGRRLLLGRNDDGYSRRSGGKSSER